MRMRFLGIIVVVALLVSCAGIRPAGAADTAPFVNVSIVDGYVGEYEEYHVRFVLGHEVKLGETLSIIFDDSINRTRLASFTARDVLIDGIPLGDATKWSGHTLTTVVPVILAAGITHELIILRGAMVQNPWNPRHIQLSLRDDASNTVLVSNYYGISNITRVLPISLTERTSGGNHVTVLVQFRTGRNGALTGNPVSPRAVDAPSSSPDTISLRFSTGLSRLWDGSETVVGWLSNPLSSLAPCRMQLVSTSSRLEDYQDRYRKQLVFGFNAKIGESTEVLVRLEFDRASVPVPLTTDDFVLVWTSKESTMVRIPMTGVPDPVPVDGNPAPEPDTPVPVITWKAQASAISSRLVTVSIDIVEANLKQAFLETGADGSLHTWLNAGHNELLLVNRSGIHGAIVATDKAGNTTRTPIDVPAPAVT